MDAGGAGIARDLRDLIDRVQELSPVQWGFVLISAAAAVAWVWVMGAPPEKRAERRRAGGAAVAAGLVVVLALALVGPHRPA